MKRYVDHILVVEINLLDPRGIGESIKRLMQLHFESAEGSYGITDYLFVQQAARSPDKQPVTFMELQPGRKVHVCGVRL